jgi:hypothetical protein
VADLLDEHSIPFALIGAAALSARGISRSTYDVDLFTVDLRVFQKELWDPIRALADIEIRRGDFSDPLKGVIWIKPSNVDRNVVDEVEQRLPDLKQEARDLWQLILRDR